MVYVDAPKLGRFMMDLTNKVGKNYELANMLSDIGEDLTEMGTPFSKRWNEYTTKQKKIIIECKRMMENGKQV